MKTNTLFKPFILSVLILVSFSTLLYLITGSPEASTCGAVMSSLGMIVLGILRAIQWIIAMTVALLFCLAFLIALFLGAIALSNRNAAAKMYGSLKTLLLSWLPSFSGRCCTSTQAPQEEAETAVQKQHEVLQAEINGVQEHLHATRQVLTDKIEQLTARIDNLEAMTTDMATKQQLDDMSHEVQDAVDALSGIQSAVSAMQSSVDQTANQLQERSPEKILGDLPQRVQGLEEQQGAGQTAEPVDISPLQDDIKAMQSELSHVKEKADKALQTAADSTATPAVQEKAQQDKPAVPAPPEKQAAAPEQEQEKETEEEHRIFSYFDAPADKEKLAELVASTLGKDMSYKQVLNFLVKEFGSDKGKIISSHPSLSKDYIRQCRKSR
ncbi:MAG: hypothetical protein WGN25_00415 [Candidatus Electrothrix sp. GW3-4]|uniref:hypothetical protein n=1 Tax=Candidatus Electrothrix sp. GW3-4 TaxID=3126740 RepID=UPI0030D21143